MIFRFWKKADIFVLHVKEYVNDINDPYNLKLLIIMKNNNNNIKNNIINIINAKNQNQIKIKIKTSLN